MGGSLQDFNYRVRLARSPLAAGFILLAGTATLALVPAIAPAPLARFLVVLWIGCAILDSYRTVALRAGKRGVLEVSLRREEIEVSDAAGRERRGTLSDGSFVAPWLTVIRWRPQGTRFDRTIVILPDMLDRESFRRLRVVLRWR